MIVFMIVIIFVLAGIISLMNDDIFSPGKLFLAFFLIFHAGIVVTDVSSTTAGLILLVLCLGLVAIVAEGVRAQGAWALWVRRRAAAATSAGESDYTAFFWIISIPSIAAQLYMIQQFDGIGGYINSIAYRVVEWSGYGWARVLIGLFVPLNIAYFAVGLTRRRSVRWWLIYLAHFLVLLAMGALSGSRSSLLAVFALQAIVFHYMHKQLTWRLASLLAGGLVFAAMLLGALRQGVKFDAGQLAIYGSRDSTLSFSAFYYGVDPLELIATTPHMPLAHGTTFFSLLTNAIPRSVWPEKPDTGGIFFTQNYAGDAWLGYSNLTPTFLGEWLINFGWVPGIVGFSLSFTIMMIVLVRYYFRTRHKLVSVREELTAIDLVIYVHTAWTVMALIPGELTNVILNFVLAQLIPLLFVRFYVKRFGRSTLAKAAPKRRIVYAHQARD